MGDSEEARRLLADLLGLHQRSYVLPYLPGVVYTGLGEHEEALNWLEMAFQDRDPYLVWIRTDHGSIDYAIINGSGAFSNALRRAQ